MPNFPEKESVLLKRLRKAHKGTADRDVWVDPDKRNKSDENDNADDSDSSEDERVVNKKPAANNANADSDDSSDSSDSDSDSSSSDEDGPDFPIQDKSLVQSVFFKNQGCLYDTEHLQVLIQTMREKQTLKMILYYKNKSEDAFTNVRCQLPNSNYMKVNVMPVTPSTDIAPKSQVKQKFMWVLQTPYTALPAIKLDFKWRGKQRSVIVGLPVLLSTFVTPADEVNNPDAYLAAYNDFAAGEVMATRKMAQYLDPEGFKNALSQLHFTVVEGIKTQANNICACGKLNTDSSTSNFLILVETRPGIPLFRLKVRSGDKALSEAIVNTISTAMKTQNA